MSRRGSKRTDGPELEPGGGALPPHSVEGEAGLLGCLLIDGGLLGECVSQFGAAGAEVFYDLRHRAIYEALVVLSEGGKPLEVVHVLEVFKGWQAAGRVQVGSWPELTNFVCGLAGRVPSAWNLPSYLELVWEKYLLRRMMQVLGNGQGKLAAAGPGQASKVLDEIEGAVLGVNAGRNEGGVRPLKELVWEAGEQVDRLKRGVGLLTGVRTRFGYFDKMTGGVHRKELAVIAARPSVGKTSWMLNMARNIAHLEGKGVGIFSMEMSAGELTLRLLCAEAEVDFHKLRTGFPSGEDLERLKGVYAVVSGMRIFIDESAALGILELRARARRLKAREGIEVVMVDYLQLMHGSRDWNGNRALEVAEISGGLKALGKELDVAMVVVSQLNRELERQRNRKPQLSDLRESGAIEQDADLVAMLYRPGCPDVNAPDAGAYEEDADVQRVNANIAKQRNGPQGDVELVFFRKWMQMRDAYENRGSREGGGFARVLEAVKGNGDGEAPSTNIQAPNNNQDPNNKWGDAE